MWGSREELNPFFLPSPTRGEPWRPSVDVYRGERGWLIKCDLAGVRLEDVKLAVSGRRLTIGGVRRDWSINKGQRAYSMEISYDRFERTIELPVNLQHAETEIDYRDGMLLITISEEDQV